MRCASLAISSWYRAVTACPAVTTALRALSFSLKDRTDPGTFFTDIAEAAVGGQKNPCPLHE